MATLFLNPFSGIAGDMLTGALLALGADQPTFWKRLRSLDLPADTWRVESEAVMRYGIAATHFKVHFHEHGHAHTHAKGHGHGHHHHHRHLPEILGIIERAALPARAKAIATRTFRALAEAEAAVHGIPPEKVHFHEVGAVDAIADIVGAAIAADLLDIDTVVCAPVHLGSGTVHCAHGDMPVPVPAVAKLLVDVPTIIGSAEGELTTPTGAALLRGLQASFGAQPPRRMTTSGYGAGTRDTAGRANVLQAILLEDAATADPGADTVAVIACNLDDITGEQIGWLLPRLLEAGALDAVALPCTMKKGRPGLQLEVLSTVDDAERLAALLLRESTTFGVRWHTASRAILRREHVEVETPWGTASVKLGYLGDEGPPLRISPEYESCRALAEAAGVPLDQIYAAARQAAHAQL